MFSGLVLEGLHCSRGNCDMMMRQKMLTQGYLKARDPSPT